MFARRPSAVAPRPLLRRVKSALDRIAVWTWRPDDDVIRASPTLKSVFGVPQLRGMEHGLSLVAPEDRHRQRRLRDSAVDSGTGYSAEYRIIRPDNGAPSEIREHAEAILDRDGSVAHLIGVSVRRPPKADPVLTLTEDLARTLLARDAMRWRAYALGLRATRPRGNWATTYRTQIVRLAGRVTSLDDFDACIRRIVAHQRRSSQRHLAAVQERRPARSAPVGARPRAATVVDRLRRVLDEVTATARQRGAASRARSSELLRELVEPLPYAALITNNAGEFVAVNAAAVRLTGYTRRELLRLSVWQITPGGDERDAETLWRVFIEQREQSGEYRVLTKTADVVAAAYFARASVLPGLHLSLLQAVDAAPRSRSGRSRRLAVV